MLLNSTELSKHVTESPYSKRTQIGIDLSVCKIQKILGGTMVLKDKTIIKPENYKDVELTNIDGKRMWLLNQGSYALTFNEGIVLPLDRTAFILQRSSLMRGGAMIVSSVWDPGFSCINMGTTLIVNEIIMIEENTRVAQLFIHENYPTNEGYSGQFQNKTNY